MEEESVIESYSINLNRRAVGLRIDAYVFVKITSHGDVHATEFEQALMQGENILACYILSGADDYLLRIVASDLDDYADFGLRVLAKLPHVREVRSGFVMRVIKETHCFPLFR